MEDENPFRLPDLNYGGVAKPGPIAGPRPTARDVVAADQFRRAVTNEGRKGNANEEAVAAAIKYEVNVSGALADHGSAALLARMEALAQQLGEMKTQITDEAREVHAEIQGVKAEIQVAMAEIQVVKAEIQVVKSIAIETQIMVAKNENASFDTDNLVEVMFPDGTCPWEQSFPGNRNTLVKLPSLESVAAVHGLTGTESHAYFKGYYPGKDVPNVAKRKQEILIAIGRGADA